MGGVCDKTACAACPGCPGIAWPKQCEHKCYNRKAAFVGNCESELNECGDCADCGGSVPAPEPPEVPKKCSQKKCYSKKSGKFKGNCASEQCDGCDECGESLLSTGVENDAVVEEEEE